MRIHDSPILARYRRNNSKLLIAKARQIGFRGDLYLDQLYRDVETVRILRMIGDITK